jgi:hypothetical protein
MLIMLIRTYNNYGFLYKYALAQEAVFISVPSDGRYKIVAMMSGATPDSVERVLTALGEHLEVEIGLGREVLWPGVGMLRSDRQGHLVWRSQASVRRRNILAPMRSVNGP